MRARERGPYSRLAGRGRRVCERHGCRGPAAGHRGLIGWDENGRFVSDDFVDQVRQTLANTVQVLASGGAGPEHVVRMTWYITDKREYLRRQRDIGAAYRETIGRHFPAMAVVEVAALLEDRAKVEIETTAVIPA